MKAKIAAKVRRRGNVIQNIAQMSIRAGYDRVDNACSGRRQLSVSVRHALSAGCPVAEMTIQRLSSGGAAA